MKCGLDIIHHSRIESLASRRGTDYLTKIWTAREIADCTKADGTLRFDSLAARFAAKEAVSKAFGTGIYREGIRPDEIEILENPLGAPYVVLHGAAETYFNQNGFQEIEISLSHDGDLAAAVCVIQ